EMRTLPTPIWNQAEMNPQAPLQVAVDSFFRANYDLSRKTERWYRENLAAFLGWSGTALGHEPRLCDLSKQLVDAYLKARITQPTRKYPKGSPFAARAAAVTLKRFASYLAQDGILADRFGVSVLKHVKRTRVDDDVRQPPSDRQL